MSKTRARLARQVGTDHCLMSAVRRQVRLLRSNRIGAEAAEDCGCVGKLVGKKCRAASTMLCFFQRCLGQRGYLNGCIRYLRWTMDASSSDEALRQIACADGDKVTKTNRARKVIYCPSTIESQSGEGRSNTRCDPTSDGWHQCYVGRIRITLMPESKPRTLIVECILRICTG